jgi:hypothetical protein
VLVGFIDQQHAVEVERVEDHVAHRNPFHQAAHVCHGREAHSLLELLEAGTAPRVERDDLPVEDHLAVVEGVRQAGQLRIPVRHVVSVPGLEAESVAIAEGDRSDPVPLELEAVPVASCRDASRELSHHWVDHGRHGPYLHSTNHLSS